MPSILLPQTKKISTAEAGGFPAQGGCASGAELLAERARFELAIPFRVCHLSKVVH